MSTEPTVKLFLLGVGYLGGSILQTFLASTSPKYAISVLVRSPAQTKELENLGVNVMMGSLSDFDVIKKMTIESDVIVNTASADDEGAVKAILQGLKDSRSFDGAAKVFLQTSGTAVIASDFDGTKAASKIYSDLDAASIDSVPDTAMHRSVDLLIKAAVDGDRLGDAKVGIVIPPIIFGLGSGPFNKISQALPMIVEHSLARKSVGLSGDGIASWNTIHIDSIMTAYETILSHLSRQMGTTSADELYWFTETGSYTWGSWGEAIKEALFKRGLVSGSVELHQEPGLSGTNARCRSDRLRALGWDPKETLTIEESTESEVDAVLKKLEEAA